MELVGVDRTSARHRTWRHDRQLIERLARDRMSSPARRPDGDYRTLLTRRTYSRFVKQLAATTAIFLLLVVGLNLPFQLGERVEQLLVRVFTTNTSLESAAATIRQLAESGRQWAVTNIGDDSLPTIFPGDPADSTENVTGDWSWPVSGTIISGFGWRQDPSGEDEFHYGLDIQAIPGTFVVAAASGRVTSVTEASSGEASGPGMIEIQHEDGWTTRYVHIGTSHVTGGDYVEAGDIIGTVGTPPDDGPARLHFEMLFDGKPVDPEPKLRRGHNGF